VFGPYVDGDETPGGPVDLLVEGDVDARELRAALSEAEEELGRPIRLRRGPAAATDSSGPRRDLDSLTFVELLDRPWPSPATGRPRARRRPDRASLAVAREATAALARAFAERLRGVWLYGSRARGDHRPDSDLDLLVVLDKVGAWRAEHDVAGDEIAALSLDHGLVITRVFASEADWQSRSTPLLRAAADDAIPLL